MAFTIKIRGAAPSSFIADHRCLTCNSVWEVSLPTEADHDTPQLCESCAAWNLVTVHSSAETRCVYNTERTYFYSAQPVTIVRGNSDFSERQGHRLHKRSSEHFKKEGRDEAIERQRAQFKREGMVQ